MDVGRWADSDDPALRNLGQQWQRVLYRDVGWKMAVERTFNFQTTAAERMTIFSEPDRVLARVRDRLPADIRDIPLNIDVARHYHRPAGPLPAGGQNFLFDPASGEPQELHDDELFRALPISFIVVRLYSRDHQHDAAVAAALNSVLGDTTDAKTNM